MSVCTPAVERRRPATSARRPHLTALSLCRSAPDTHPDGAANRRSAISTRAARGRALLPWRGWTRRPGQGQRTQARAPPPPEHPVERGERTASRVRLATTTPVHLAPSRDHLRLRVPSSMDEPTRRVVTPAHTRTRPPTTRAVGAERRGGVRRAQSGWSRKTRPTRSLRPSPGAGQAEA